MAENTYNLQRFIQAQADIYPDVLEELRAGRKRSHWMWFIFPQLKGLGVSEISRYYAISNLEEARAFFSHPILGKRLLECCQILNQLTNHTAYEIFGFPDEMKLRSCLTLFHLAVPDEAIFDFLLDQYFNAEIDEKTIELLKR